MIFFIISIFAGILTVLAPCILPLLPIVVGASDEGSKRGISKKAITVISSLSLSVILFTLLLKASTLLITIPQIFWNYFSGGILVLLGVFLIFPDFWSNIKLVNKLSLASNKLLGFGFKKGNYTGDVLMGFALGPVFTTCSPTYLFIVATLLPLSFVLGFVYLLGFVFGLALSLFFVAYFGQFLIGKINKNANSALKIKKFFGILILLVGVLIITQLDKKIQTFILDLGFEGVVLFEKSLVDDFAPMQ